MICHLKARVRASVLLVVEGSRSGPPDSLSAGAAAGAASWRLLLELLWHSSCHQSRAIFQHHLHSFRLTFPHFSSFPVESFYFGKMFFRHDTGVLSISVVDWGAILWCSYLHLEVCISAAYGAAILYTLPSVVRGGARLRPSPACNCLVVPCLWPHRGG